MKAFVFLALAFSAIPAFASDYCPDQATHFCVCGGRFGTEVFPANKIVRVDIVDGNRFATVIGKESSPDLCRHAIENNRYQSCH